jgi:pimeloyl-ACP methyl ester carboxylesterase
LPGLLCDAALWQPQLAGLADIAKAEVPDLTRDDSVAAMAARVLAAAPPRFALAGLSMGGYVAFEILRQQPERVTRLALLDTSARPDTPLQIGFRRELIALATQGAFRLVPNRLLPLYIHASRLSDAALAHRINEMAERLGPEVFLRQQGAIMGRPDSRPLLPRIACPTLILCGRVDTRTPPALHEEMATLIPGSRLEMIEECGHLATLERPDEVNAALRRWLEDCFPNPI